MMQLNIVQSINGYNVFELIKKLLGNEIYYISPLNEINVGTVITVELDSVVILNGLYTVDSSEDCRDITVHIKTLKCSFLS